MGENNGTAFNDGFVENMHPTLEGGYCHSNLDPFVMKIVEKGHVRGSVELMGVHSEFSGVGSSNGGAGLQDMGRGLEEELSGHVVSSNGGVTSKERETCSKNREDGLILCSPVKILKRSGSCPLLGGMSLKDGAFEKLESKKDIDKEQHVGLAGIVFNRVRKIWGGSSN
ncbi:hypothetical protein TSUD_13280 [Trifolium subterraneum]|uniref:Uncharacterized protein n=1 Tax=Trifolium subterraneum TaxID=3900 RepID=A0A2Z6P116_TRISU|nr:hypothetical protein TSUD_13280 [Trifolium subterraneum]